MRRLALVCLLVLVLAPACKKKRSEPAAAGQAAGAPAAARDAGGAGGQAGKPEGGEEEARDLVEAWVEAQNGRDFARYAALYAAEFRGVRRSGKKVVELDQAGWLADRKRMFGKPMQVVVEDLVIGRDGDAVTATFTQTWSSGTYSDRGPKRMHLEVRAGALRIVREEMLDSQLLGNEDTCRRLLAAGGEAVASVKALVPNPGPRLVCVGEVGEGEATELVVLLAGLEGGSWAELGRTGADLADSSEHDGEVTTTRTASVTEVAIAPAENALWLEREEVTEGPQFSDRKSEQVLLRVTGDAPTPIFSAESSVSVGEADRTDAASVTVTDKLTRGFYEIEVVRERSSAQWAAGEGLVEEDPETSRWVWDGHAYDEK